MQPLRLAVIGTGFWARFQLAAWRELSGVEIVALYNRTRAKAEALAGEFGVAEVYDDAEQLLREVQPDAVDIITDVDTHSRFVRLAAANGIAAICQKPLAPSLDQAEAMAAACRNAGVQLLVHENFRWQAPIRHLKQLLDAGTIGQPFRGRLQFASSFPVFENQPFLARLEQFILTDVGAHIFDVARCLFGDAQRIYCQTQRINQGIRGEDVATALTEHGKLTCITDLSYASRLERERFPETFILVEGEHGSIELGPDYRISVTTADGTHTQRVPPPRYSWADPAYAVVHASIVPCNQNLLAALRGEGQAETTADDNLRSLGLVFAAYESAATGRAVELVHPGGNEPMGFDGL